MKEIKRELLRIGDDLYEIKRKIIDSSSIEVEKWKIIIGAEKVFRKNGYLLFCKIVEEAEIEEIIEISNDIENLNS